jgi:flagellar motor component MotA
MIRHTRARPDFATLAGLALAAAGILGGLLLEKGSLSDIAQGTAALIVFGGTLGGSGHDPSRFRAQRATRLARHLLGAAR